MQNFIIKIKDALKEIEEEKGPFDLKYLVAKNPEVISWDLVLAAKWFEQDEIERLEYLTSKILKSFTSEDFIQFSSIITINQKSDLGEFLSSFENGVSQRYGNRFFKQELIYETGEEIAPLIMPLVNSV